MPGMRWQGAITEDINEKAMALATRFYPEVEADLSDITEHEFTDDIARVALDINRTVNETDI